MRKRIRKRMKGCKKTICVLTLCLAALAAVSCRIGVEDGPDMKIGSTLLVYMAADNNLASNARADIEEMMKGNVPYYFNEGEGDVLLVYADISGEAPRLIRISKDSYGAVNQEVLMEYEEQNSLSDTVMRSVLSYAAELFPSENNGLVLWSHGTGWLPEGYYSKPYSVSAGGQAVPVQVMEDPYAAFVKSFGSSPDGEMDIKDLAEALPLRYSYIVMDACLMGGVEVAYELKDRCRYFVGSAAEILAQGFPYDKVLGCLLDGSLDSLKMACRHFYDSYADQGATISVVDTYALNSLAEACVDIFLSTRPAVSSLNMSMLQRYYRLNKHWFYDLEDFVCNLSPSEEMLDRFRSAMARTVVYRLATENFIIGATNCFPIKTFSGLSTYVPNPENSVLEEYYRTLAWNRAVMLVE